MSQPAHSEESLSPLSSLARLRQKLKTLVDLYATPLTVSHYLELVNPLWASHNLQAKVVEVWDETKDARTLTLRPGRNWRAHRAGQHMRVGVPIGGRHYTRTYSISSPPSRGDGLITITVKAIDQGRMSNHLVRNLKPGAYLPIGLPQGNFVLPWAMPVKPLFISAGSGITPVMSMLRNYRDEGTLPDTVHIHYAPHEYDVIFGNELREMAKQHSALYHLRQIYTRETDNAAGNSGPHTCKPHFSAAQLDALCPDWRSRECWACGPQSLLDALETHYAEAGLSHLLHVERFRAALAPIPDDATGGQVCFSSEGAELEVSADGVTPLLRVAEDAGLNPPHGCRMGICRTCDVPMLQGRVRDLRDGSIVEVGPQDAAKTIQTCVCAAAGDCRIDLPRNN